ncbi:MAG TPA: CDP-diacylglycerol--glycerol-3-phosphate 3-phosphatidyltransferase [Nitrospiria bacterium]|jgi:cardiolipin synthase
MNVPNGLTLFRILLIPFFINFLVYHYYLYALLIFLLASLTDGLDGFIARVSNQRTKLGSYLDPMADKLLLTAAFITLAYLKFIPVWITIVVVSRDAILLLGTLLLHLTQMNINMLPTLMGKSTTLFQLVCILAILFFVVFQKDTSNLSPLLFLTVGLTIISGLQYLFRWVRLMNHEGTQFV